MSVLSMMSMMEQKPVSIAPKDSPASKGTPNGDGESCMPYTCITCARRKVKCDKVIPKCSTCRKARLDCLYQEPAPRKRKRKPVEDINERLEQYEKILKANGLLPGEEGTPQQSKSGVVESHQWPFFEAKSDGKGQANNGGKLVGGEGKARYIGSTVFKNLGDDFEVSSEEEDDDAAVVQPTAKLQAASGDPLSMALMSTANSPQSLLDFHPTYEKALKLWKLYVDNVDPVVKAVHVPTMATILKRSAAQPSAIPRATEALLFTIYHFGATSISDEECFNTFGETRKALLSRYEMASRQALVNAQWLRSTNLAVVQAFILFLLAVRNSYDPHTFWILTGVAVRLGQRIGLHRDGEELGLGPFETQMRRRIFWQLLPLDGIAGQLSGFGISVTLDSWSTKQPLNLNDTDIWPDMTEPPEPRTGATDMMFCLARTEMAKIVRHAFLSNLSQKENMQGVHEAFFNEDFKVKWGHLSALEDEMESKYLRYCDFANPLHQVTMAMARAGINGGRLRIRLARSRAGQDVSEQERKEIWEIANRVLDYHINASTNHTMARYWWHLRTFFQSDAMVWVLNELRRDPALYKDSDGWKKIEDTYKAHPDLAVQKRSLHAAVGRLTLKAWDATQAWRQANNEPVPPDPAYITAVRLRPSRKESSLASNDPTPTQSSNWTYNPFNPGADFEEAVLPTQSSASTFQATDGFVGNGPVDTNSMWMAQLQDFNAPGVALNDFDFNQMVDPGTGQIDWMFWDQLSRDQTSLGPRGIN